MLRDACLQQSKSQRCEQTFCLSCFTLSLHGEVKIYANESKTQAWNKKQRIKQTVHLISGLIVCIQHKHKKLVLRAREPWSQLLFPTSASLHVFFKQKHLLSHSDTTVKHPAHTRADISAYETCFLTHAVLEQNPWPNNFFQLISWHILQLRDGGQYPSRCLGTGSSGIIEGFLKWFSISPTVCGSVLSCWKEDAASQQPTEFNTFSWQQAINVAQDIQTSVCHRTNIKLGTFMIITKLKKQEHHFYIFLLNPTKAFL